MAEMKDEIVNTFGNKLRLRISGICIHNNEILLVKHKALNEVGELWAPPGGGMNYGETAIETLQREFKEETDLDIEVGELLFVNEYLDKPLHAVEMFFEVKIVGNQNVIIGYDPEMLDNQIITDVKFVSWEKIKSDDQRKYHSFIHRLNELEDVYRLKGYLHSK